MPKSQAVEKTPAEAGEKKYRDRLSLRLERVYKLGEVTLEATCFVFVKQTDFDTPVDEGDGAGKQQRCCILFSLAAKFLDCGACARHPVTIPQTTYCVLADSFLGTGVISHFLYYSYFYCLNFRTANIGIGQKNKKFFPRFILRKHI
jgi:hypothetical protein